MIKKLTLAMTGASGTPYMLRLMKCCLEAEIHVQFLCSQAGQIVLGLESDLKLTGSPQKMQRQLCDYFKADSSLISAYGKDQWTGPPASGSSVADAMVVCPCTMATLASIACGTSENLINRAADVIIKERKKLVLVPRETPFSSIHLGNMLKLSDLGVVILPPNPGFYQGVNTVSDLVDFVVARILDQLDIPNEISPRWAAKD
ncbi:MAG: 4-hydroxy-3-polyprenylbenzoate decarboxylase [Gammaproteobacteria bacterium]|jgi:4-hydroxy-3-polyprenylbenzoate decarboxylase|tara:strand:+ start:569 stop:1177 length:609 start_codon:yes stop_codon:yes gene_type:complete